MTNQKLAILVFELGHLQVFHYQDMESWVKKIQPTELFWHRKGDPISHGPYPSIWDAVQNYSSFIAEEKNPTPANLIQVDFKTKKKIPNTIA